MHHGNWGRQRTAEKIVNWLAIICIVVAFLVFGGVFYNAFGRDGGQWDQQPANIRSWYQHLMQPDNPQVSCCGEADAFEADSYDTEGDHYVAIITNGKGMIPEGTRIPVPNSKMKWSDGNPTGHGVIFIGTQGQVFCFVTPGGT